MLEDGDRFEYRDGRVRLADLDLDPKACWDLSEALRQFLVTHHAEFEHPPTKTVRKNSREFDVLVTSNLRFWEDLEGGRWEPHTFRIFDRFLTSEHVYIDIGSWIGPTLFYAAQKAQKAYGFEPDPIAFEELALNLKANASPWSQRVEVTQQAITVDGGRVRLGNLNQAGNSQSSLLFQGESTSWSVDSVTLERFLDSEGLLGRKLFIKMDIEGAEYELLPTLKSLLRKLDATFYLSIHPEILSSTESPGAIGRLRFAIKHYKLIRSLPFRFLHHKGGQRLKPWKQIAKALLKRTFPKELVATNQLW